MFGYGIERKRGTAVFCYIACYFFYLSVTGIIRSYRGSINGLFFQTFGKNNKFCNTTFC